MTSCPGVSRQQGFSGWSSFGAKAGKVPESCEGKVTVSPRDDVQHQTRSWAKSAGTRPGSETAVKLKQGGRVTAQPASPAVPSSPLCSEGQIESVLTSLANNLTLAGVRAHLTLGVCDFTTHDNLYVLRRTQHCLCPGCSYLDQGGSCGLRVSELGYFAKCKEDGLSSYSPFSVPSLPRTSFHRSVSAPTLYFLKADA